MCAPDASQWQFWAPSAIGLPARISATAASAVNGRAHHDLDAARTLEPVADAPLASARASASVPFIFQLPTTSGVRIRPP